MGELKTNEMVLAYCAIGIFLLCWSYILFDLLRTITSNQVKIGKLLIEMLKKQNENKATQKD